MNDLVTQKVQLPAHLQALAGKSVAVLGGLALGAAFHSIGIGQSRWRLYNPQGQELVVPALHLDVIVIDANPNLSKRFYLKAYDKDAKPTAPDCFSDNGVAPSVRSAHPQSVSCAQCPHNVWGSKVTPSGKQTKACADSKILAIILADNPTGPVYQLSVPPASLKNLHSFGTQLESRGIPMPSMVVRLTFDSDADYPRILFTPSGWATEAQVAAVIDVLDSDEVNVVTNKNDVPRTAPVGQSVQPVQTAPTQGDINVAAALNQGTQASYVPPAATPAQEAPKRVRRTKAELAAATPAPQPAAPAQPAPAAAQPASGFFANLQQKATPAPQPAAPAQPAPAAAQPASGFFANLQQKAAPEASKPAPQINTAPQPTNQALDDLLAQAFKV